MRLLLTRALEDSERLRDELAEKGIESVLAPMLSIRFFDMATDVEGPVQAYLVTSRYGADALGRFTTDRTTTVLAVGRASAERLKGLGFRDVEDADGTASDLVRLAARRLSPEQGPVLFVSAESVAGDVESSLKARGFELRRIVAYRAETAERFPDMAHDALTNGDLDGVLLFSPRTARAFQELAAAEGLEKTAEYMTAYCISEAVAEAVASLSWKRVLVAAHPNKSDLLALLDTPCHKDA